MKGQYSLSRRAQRDLQAIADFIKRDSPPAALRWVNHLEKQCQKIADMPRLGRPREDLAKSLRYFPVARYIIFYREQKRGIIIVRVLHSARDVKTIL